MNAVSDITLRGMVACPGSAGGFALKNFEDNSKRPEVYILVAKDAKALWDTGNLIPSARGVITRYGGICSHLAGECLLCNIPYFVGVDIRRIKANKFITMRCDNTEGIGIVNI